MPIIKSSANGEDITVVVFTQSEIDALVNVLWNAKVPRSKDVRQSVEVLEEFYYALGIPYPPE